MPKRIVFLAAKASHGWGGHAHGAQCMLFARLLNENVPGVAATVHKGWPEDAAVLQGAAAIVLSCDGNGLIGNRYEELDALVRKGTGLAFLHYALDVGKGQRGNYVLDWIGGYYEQHWSVNPTWKAEFKALPGHPITRGVRPFTLHDEWYYHMRFRENMQGVTPILSAVPPEVTRQGRDGPHSGNPHVRARAGMAEHLAWAYQRSDGARGFGFTGGHVYWNWANDDLRKLMLNAFVWVAGMDVPSGGIVTRRPTPEEMEANHEIPKPSNWNPDSTKRMIERVNQRPE